jgi:predicted HAD superfamily phosphohydrolase
MFNHAYEIAFSLDSYWTQPTPEELREAIRKRMEVIEKMSDEELMECCGEPYETITYKNENDVLILDGAVYVPVVDDKDQTQLKQVK